MRGLIVALLAILLVASDTGRDTRQLLRNATQATHPETLLWRAATNGSEIAEQRLVAHAVDNNEKYWLNKLVSLDNADAAWALYQMIGDDAAGDKLMRLAAIGDVPEAQMEYALATNDPVRRETWLRRAAKQGHLPAQAALADWYLLQGMVEQAKPWLQKSAEAYPQSAFQYGRLLWDEGDRENAKKWIHTAAEHELKRAQRVESILQKYSPYTLANVPYSDVRQSRDCQQTIGVFATSLATIVKADELVNAYRKDRRLTSLPLCIDAPIWLDNDQLECESSWRDSGRLGCDIRPMAQVVERRGLTHAIIVSNQGKANVNNGVMFLDLTDTYSVFVHELAHFSGFVDEYALSRGTAERVCNKNTDAPNLIFEGQLTYAPLSRLDNWLKLHPGTAIWESRSCDAIGVNAYKPSAKVTFLEHHDSGEIPSVYLKLWAQQLRKKSAQHPISMNLFQAFQKNSQLAKAKKWLRRYQDAIRPRELAPSMAERGEALPTEDTVPLQY